MGKFYGHPAITSRGYADGLTNSWNNHKLTVFPFLLAQADQGDLKEAKQRWEYDNYQEFRKAIDDAYPNAGPAGERLSAPLTEK